MEKIIIGLVIVLIILICIVAYLHKKVNRFEGVLIDFLWVLSELSEKNNWGIKVVIDGEEYGGDSQ